MSLRFAFAGFVAALGVLVSGSSADAAFKLSISADGGPATVITDGGAGDLFAGVPNQIVFAGAVGNFFVSFDSALTNAPGVGPIAQLLNNVTVNRIGGTGTGTLTILATATGFTSPVGPLLTLSNSGSGTFGPGGTTAGNNATVQGFADPANAEFGQTVASASESGTVPGSAPPSFGFGTGVADSQAFVGSADPFSITNMIMVTLSEGRVFSASVVTQVEGEPDFGPVPEPGTMALLALGGLGFVGRAVRRRRIAEKV